MELKDIMSVSGQGGLFRFVSQARNGIIVESFNDKKRIFVSAATKVSSLADVAVFTDSNEVPLSEVLSNIHNQGPEFSVPDGKASSEVLRNFMEKVLPNFDRNRVYISDMKKIAGWYSIIKDNGLIDFTAVADKEKGESTEPQEK